MLTNGNSKWPRRRGSRHPGALDSTLVGGTDSEEGYARELTAPILNPAVFAARLHAEFACTTVERAFGAAKDKASEDVSRGHIRVMGRRRIDFVSHGRSTSP